MLDVGAYLGLAATAFLAATIIPAQSEAALVALLVSGRYSAWSLIAIASFANVAGSLVNWGFGRGIERFTDARWFPVRRPALDRASGWYRHYGRCSLLLSWLPFIGDPLTVAAGVLKEPFWSFLLLVGVAKTTRYIVLAFATLNWI